MPFPILHNVWHIRIHSPNAWASNQPIHIHCIAPYCVLLPSWILISLFPYRLALVGVAAVVAAVIGQVLKYVAYTHKRIWWNFVREPFVTLSHWIALILSLCAGAVLYDEQACTRSNWTDKEWRTFTSFLPTRSHRCHNFSQFHLSAVHPHQLLLFTRTPTYTHTHTHTIHLSLSVSPECLQFVLFLFIFFLCLSFAFTYAPQFLACHFWFSVRAKEGKKGAFMLSFITACLLRDSRSWCCCCCAAACNANTYAQIPKLAHQATTMPSHKTITLHRITFSAPPHHTIRQAQSSLSVASNCAQMTENVKFMSKIALLKSQLEKNQAIAAARWRGTATEPERNRRQTMCMYAMNLNRFRWS